MQRARSEQPSDAPQRRKRSATRGRRQTGAYDRGKNAVAMAACGEVGMAEEEGEDPVLVDLGITSAGGEQVATRAFVAPCRADNRVSGRVRPHAGDAREPEGADGGLAQRGTHAHAPAHGDAETRARASGIRASEEVEEEEEPTVACAGAGAGTFVGATMRIVVPNARRSTGRGGGDPRSRPPVPDTALPHPPHIVAKTARLGSHYEVDKRGLDDAALEPHRRWLTFTLTPCGGGGGVPAGRSSTDGRRGKRARDADVSGAAKKPPPPPPPPLADGCAAYRQLQQQMRDGNGSAAVTHRLYEETERWFSVPRYYGLARWGMVRPENDVRTTGEPIAVRFEGSLTDMQRETYERVMHQLTRDPHGMPGGIIKVPCGGGKTVLAIRIICGLGVKALFSVQREDAMDNTEAEVRRFAPGARIGRIQQGRCEVDGCDIVIAMIQTVLARDHAPEVFAPFGLWVADEMHHMEAPCFSRMRGKLRCRWTIGLSATPRRRDGTTRALFWGFGPLIVDIRRVWREGQVVARMVRCASACCEQGHGSRPIKTDTLIERAMAISRLAQNEARNLCIVRLLCDCILRPWPKPIARRVMVLSDRREQLDYIRQAYLDEMCYRMSACGSRARTCMPPSACAAGSVPSAHDARAHAAPAGVPATVASAPSCAAPPPRSPRRQRYVVDDTERNCWRLLAVDDPDDDGVAAPDDTAVAWDAGTAAAPTTITTVGYLVGGLKMGERESGKRCQVVLATYGLANEAVNIPELDTVLMATPRSDVEQATGRALRAYSPKNDPMMIFVVDPIGKFAEYADSVAAYFHRERYSVQWEDV